MAKTIDLTKKLEYSGVAAYGQSKYYQKEGNKQEFFLSPSGKMTHLAQKMHNGDWKILKSWRTELTIPLY